MAIWPKIVRERPVVSLLTVGITALVFLRIAALGPVVLTSAAVLSLIGMAIYVWVRTVREARARAAYDPFTFADVIVRMRAKDEAQALRNEQLRLARVSSR